MESAVSDCAAFRCLQSNSSTPVVIIVDSRSIHVVPAKISTRSAPERCIRDACRGAAATLRGLGVRHAWETGACADGEYTAVDRGAFGAHHHQTSLSFYIYRQRRTSRASSIIRVLEHHHRSCRRAAYPLTGRGISIATARNQTGSSSRSLGNAWHRPRRGQTAKATSLDIYAAQPVCEKRC